MVFYPAFFLHGILNGFLNGFLSCVFLNGFGIHLNGIQYPYEKVSIPDSVFFIIRLS